MAFMTINYKSPTIGMNQSFTAIVPEDDSFFKQHEPVKPLKMLLLLHGLSSDATSYMRLTSIERYAEAHQLAVIMPNVHQILPLSRKREDNFIAGHSMGGYGTIKFALTQSHLFSKAAPLSAVFDVQSLLDIEWNDFDPKAIAGDALKVKGTELDTYHLVDEAVDKDATLPELFIQCGTEDFLYDDNQRFMKYLDEKSINYKYEEGPGEHDYAFWDKAIERTIEWLVEK